MLRSELHGDDWIIPAIRMKGKLEHVVPLSPTAKAIIEGYPIWASLCSRLMGDAQREISLMTSASSMKPVASPGGVSMI
jgi:integrase